MNLEQNDKKYIARDQDAEKIQIVKTSGNYLVDSSGKQYLDFTSGWGVGNLGWGLKELKKTINNYNGPDYVGPNFLYKPWVELAEKLIKMAPGKLKKCFRATGGSEAVEIAMQAAISHTKRQKFISVEEAYHGDTIATRCIGTPAYDDWFKNPFDGHRMKPPFTLKSMEQIEKWLGKKDIAAVIMEPVVLALNVEMPSDDFMIELQKLCRKYGTLLIMDEIATGFGRTGKIFASEHFSIEPDIMCLAKAITAGYSPMGAVLTTDAVAKSMHYESSYYSTYGWHPLSVQVALANIDYIQSHQPQLLKNVELMSIFISQRLHAMNFSSFPEIKVCGLAIGVQFEEESYGEKIISKAQDAGLLLASGNSGFNILPALNITKKVAKAGMDILQDIL